MSETSRVDREFLKSALTLASQSEIDHLLFISDTPLTGNELRGKKCRKKIIYAVTNDQVAAELLEKPRLEPLQALGLDVGMPDSLLYAASTRFELQLPPVKAGESVL